MKPTAQREGGPITSPAPSRRMADQTIAGAVSERNSRADALRQALEDCPMPTWVWNILEPMPPLPKAGVQAKKLEPLRSQTNPLRSVSPPSA